MSKKKWPIARRYMMKPSRPVTHPRVMGFSPLPALAPPPLTLSHHQRRFLLPRIMEGESGPSPLGGGAPRAAMARLGRVWLSMVPSRGGEARLWWPTVAAGLCALASKGSRGWGIVMARSTTGGNNGSTGVQDNGSTACPFAAGRPKLHTPIWP
jgi:hypothetical protein